MRNLQLRPPGSPVWNFTQVQFHSSLVEASLLGGTDILHPEPYGLRHGGASHDVLSKRRGLSSVKKRGRWRDGRSVRHYEKATVALHELNKLHPNIIQFGRLIADNLGNAFRKVLPISRSRQGKSGSLRSRSSKAAAPARSLEAREINAASSSRSLQALEKSRATPAKAALPPSPSASRSTPSWT